MYLSSWLGSTLSSAVNQTALHIQLAGRTMSEELERPCAEGSPIRLLHRTQVLGFTSFFLTLHSCQCFSVSRLKFYRGT